MLQREVEALLRFRLLAPSNSSQILSQALQLGMPEVRRAGELLLSAPESALWRAALQSRLVLGLRLGVGDIFHAGYESTLSNYAALKSIEKRRQFFMSLKLQEKELRQAPAEQNECHLSVGATAVPHARAYELALDEKEIDLEPSTRSPWLLEPAHAAACVLKSNFLQHLEECAASGHKLCIWDPFCGKGTMILEALGIALGVPPASPAMMMPFQNFPDFNQMHFQEVLQSLQLTPHPQIQQLLLLGSHEGHPELVKLAHLNLQAFARSLPRSRGPSLLWAPSRGGEEDSRSLVTHRLPCQIAFHSLPAATVAEQIRGHRPLIMTNVPYGKKSEARKDQRAYKRFGQMVKSLDVKGAYCLSAREDFKKLSGLDWRTELRFSSAGVWLELLRWTGQEALEVSAAVVQSASEKAIASEKVRIYRDGKLKRYEMLRADSLPLLNGRYEPRTTTLSLAQARVVLTVELLAELPILCYTLANQDSDEQAPILQYLLRNGCDPNAPDGYGCAPFWYATEAGHDAAASLLLCGALMGS
ncbi:unnamed protein product [Durusdinium trenchii]|uniref:Uncharacterized protein n=1 Tax=Durusdinium trenchii TaxID=1381693 RepID=A0ABP0NF00_9DINO